MSGLMKNTKLLGIILCTGAIALILAGCRTPEEHVKDADEEVYSIMDQKWQDNFGYKANYRIVRHRNIVSGNTNPLSLSGYFEFVKLQHSYSPMNSVFSKFQK